MIFYTADTHFDHINIIKYCNRPFSSIEEMNQAIIDNWNNVIGINDIVYHLGDVRFKNNFDLSQLNGHKYLIPGNHDQKSLVHLKWYFEILDAIYVDKENQIVLCHYPIHDWPHKNKKWLHLHGHSHGTVNIDLRAIDVGVDCWNFKPITLEQIKDAASL